jgi:hypothetical protein
MDSLLAPVELNRDTSRMLDEIRSGADNALYGASPADAEKKIQSCVLPLIEGAGLLNLQVVHYRWYLREMARLWRSRKGSDLAFHLEHCIRKWVGLGLEPRTLQFLACETYQRLKAGQPPTADSLPPTASTPTPDNETAKSEHSIPQSLDPSIPCSTTPATQPACEGKQG